MTLFQLQLIWWLQIIAAVEMKPTDPKNWEEVVKQLIGYLRRILREQLDRRFVFGLTLGPDMMTVWMHDRSGVIGTKTAINIHKVGEISILLVRWTTNNSSLAGTAQIHSSNCRFLTFTARKAWI
jgi:hypothetical protein